MTSASDRSGADSVLDMLGSLWAPATEAHRVRAALNVRSLAETAAAAERAGYEVCAIDLPATVSGFATRIADKPHIVVNRAESSARQQYTVVHELGHHALRENPSQHLNPGMDELRADLFATFWVIGVTDGAEQHEVLRQNRESSACLFVLGLMTVGLLAAALVVHLLSRPAVPAASTL
jgi:hypothetical protein